MWAFELTHRAAEIAAGLGVPKLRFAPGPLPSAGDTPEVEKAVSPGPEDLRRAAEIAASVEDEKLRESVQKAVALSLARHPSNRPF